MGDKNQLIRVRQADFQGLTPIKKGLKSVILRSLNSFISKKKLKFKFKNYTTVEILNLDEVCKK